MTSTDFSATPRITQTVLEHYNKHYDNDLYRAFRDALAANLPGGTAHPDHVVLMNWLTDAAFDRSGAEGYQAAFAQLGAALMRFGDSELFILAEQHLAQFSPTPTETLLIAGLTHTANVLHAQAAQALPVASDCHTWRGRAAFWWLNAIAALSQAASALLTEQDTSYIQEKLGHSLRYLRNGVSEWAMINVSLTQPLLKWLLRFPIE